MPGTRIGASSFSGGSKLTESGAGGLGAAVKEAQDRVNVPAISRVVGGTSVSITGAPVSAEIVGIGLAQLQAKSSLAVGVGTAKLTFTAVRPGGLGNDITVEIVQGVGALAVALTAKAVEITLAAAGSTADAVKTALDADVPIARLIATVSGGVGTVLIAAEQYLIGGGGLGQTKAFLQLFGGTTAELNFEANRPGLPGEDISVEIVDSTSGNLAVTATAGAIEIDFGGDTPTAAQIKTAYDAVTDAVRLATIEHDGVAGAGLPAVIAETNLADGNGEGLSVKVNGIEQGVEGAVTETSVGMEVATFTGAANGDAAVLQVISNGLAGDPITLGIVT